MARKLLFASVLVAGAFSCLGFAQDTVGVQASQALLRRFQADHKSVATGAAVFALRNDLSSRAKLGRVVEAVLQADLRFSDGTVMRKGTVLSGAVTAAQNHSKEDPVSKLTVDWTSAQISRKELLPIAVLVRDAQGNAPIAMADHSFGQNQVGATSNSPHVGDPLSTGMNSVLMNKQAGMPEIVPGVHLEPSGGHSLNAVGGNEDLVLGEGTKLVMVVFKDLTPVLTK